MLFELGEDLHIGAKLKVIGIGGAGGNAVSAMIAFGVQGVDFIAANTDLQALHSSPAPTKLQLGTQSTMGLGTGANPELGRKAALEDAERVSDMLAGSDMVFLTAGMGGGTGTGAAPVIAEIAKDRGALTVAVVTKPFLFEGKKRLSQADAGLKELKEACDTVITVPNQRLLNVIARNTTLTEAFRVANDVLRQAVQGISDLVTVPGLINLDFADVKTIMVDMGMALMGTGTASGENRAVEAAQRAISSPLLEESSIQGAQGILINVTGGPDLTLYETNEAATLVQEASHDDAHIIFGAVIEEEMKENIRVTVIATGFGDEVRASGTFGQSPARTSTSQPMSEGDLPSRVSLPTSGALAYQPYEEDELDIPTFLRKKPD